MTTDILDYNTLPLGNHLQRVNVTFRQQMKDEEQRLTRDAGARALEFVLDSSKVGSRVQALQLKAKANGIAASLEVYDSNVRYLESYTQFFVETTKRLLSAYEYAVGEARNLALTAVSALPENQEERHLAARIAHAKSEGQRHVFEQFEVVYREARARAEREAAEAAAAADGKQ